MIARVASSCTSVTLRAVAGWLPAALRGALVLPLTAALLMAACSGEAEVTSTPPATPRAEATASATAPAGTSATASPAPEHTASPQPAAEITIAAVGDLMLARDVATLMQQHGPIYPFERVTHLWEDADLVVGNMEGTFSLAGDPLEKYYTFRTPPQLAAGLRESGFDAVSLANNHAFDFGEQGLRETLGALAGVGVRSFGAGLNEEIARAPLLLEANEARVAFLGYDEIGETQFAREREPGVARADLRSITFDVRRAAAGADFVIVSLHAGTEYAHEVTGRQRELARGAIDAGADVVIGHHPHVLQPRERYRDGLILYSLGNFVFDLDADDLEVLGPGPFQSAVALIELHGERPPAVTFRPVMIDVGENRPRPAHGDEGEQVSAALEPLPAPVGRFEPVAPAGRARSLHTATRLPDGRVVIIGGSASRSVLGDVEIFDPASGGIDAAGEIAEPRQTHAATLLPDGRILVSGGTADEPVRSVEIFDPATGRSRVAGELLVPRVGHATSLLPDGTVLIAGGGPDGPSAEIFDPDDGSSAEVGPPSTDPTFGTIEQLPDRRLLLLGRSGAVEYYDVYTRTFRPVELPPLPVLGSTATLLADGRVLLTGGTDRAAAEAAPPAPANSHGESIESTAFAAIWDPANGELQRLPDMFTPRSGHRATLLSDGRVLISGGARDTHFELPLVARAEIFDPRTGRFEEVARMSDRRIWHTATPLADGRVLIVGASGEPYERPAEILVLP